MVTSANAKQPRRLEKLPYKSRRKCTCGCEQKKTHTGFSGDLPLISGCELSIRRWVRDGDPFV